MVKITEATNSPARPRRGKGQPVLVRDPRFTYVRSAPRFNSGHNAYWRWFMRQEFALAARWACAPEPISFQTAVEMAKGTEFIPRDILVMCSMGTYYSIVLPDGRELEIGRMATSNVQYILSLLDPLKGAVIAYDGQAWNALAPGAQSQVLTMDGGLAVWRNSTGGGGGGGVSQANWKTPAAVYTANDTGSFATLANAFYVAETCAIDGLRLTLNAASSGVTYSAFIAEINSSGQIIGTLGTALATWTATASGPATVTFDLTAVTLNPGTPYIVAAVITSGSGTTACRMYTQSTINTLGYTDAPLDLGMMLAVWSSNTKRFWYTSNSTAPAGVSPASNSPNGTYAIGFHMVAP